MEKETGEARELVEAMGERVDMEMGGLRGLVEFEVRELDGSLRVKHLGIVVEETEEKVEMVEELGQDTVNENLKRMEGEVKNDFDEMAEKFGIEGKFEGIEDKFETFST